MTEQGTFEVLKAAQGDFASFLDEYMNQQDEEEEELVEAQAGVVCTEQDERTLSA